MAARALIVAVLALLIADALHKAAPGRLGIPQPSGSGADLYFRELGVPPDAGPPTALRHVDQDGMVSDYASGIYHVQHTSEDVFGYYRTTFRRVGLTSPASSETLIYYPEAPCSGAAIVTVTPQCTGSKCNVFVEVTG